ncbi:MAG: hypothetical protein JW874_14550 [Spirochaetales bacterium]|nr:hypothetical protein [Spirochaetales bacterium]
MKRTAFTILLAVIVLVFVSGEELTEEEMVKVFSVTFAAYFEASMTYSFTQELPEGVTVSADNMTVTFTNYNIEKFEEGYTSLSGKFFMDPQKGLKADISLKGGPVKTILYAVPLTQLNSLSTSKAPVTMKLVVNGIDYSIVIPAKN